MNALMNRVVRHPDWKYFAAPVYAKDGKSYSFYDPADTGDMREAANHFVDNCRYWLSGIKRHTGPSVLFKYFMEAGIDVGGAELMYGPHEVILSALRGASLAYGKRNLPLTWRFSGLPRRMIRRIVCAAISFLCLSAISREPIISIRKRGCGGSKSILLILTGSAIPVRSI